LVGKHPVTLLLLSSFETEAQAFFVSSTLAFIPVYFPHLFFFFSSIILLLPLSPWFGKDLVSQTHSKTITTPPRRPLISPFSNLPSSRYASIYPSIDCHYSWTSVIPLLVQLGFPFPSHHSAVFVCVCVCACVGVCVCACVLTFVFLSVVLSVRFD